MIHFHILRENDQWQALLKHSRIKFCDKNSAEPLN